MRKLLLSVLFLCGLFMGLVSCEKEQAPENISISEKIFMSTSRLRANFSTTFTAKTDWKVYTRNDWIILTSELEGAPGKHTLSFTITGLPGSSNYRKGYVYIETPGKRYDLPVEQGRQYNTHGQSNM